jgi:hypothetical protein
MNRTTYIIAGLTGGLLSAWLWRRTRSHGRSNVPRTRDRGEVIFDNTPTASEPPAF